MVICLHVFLALVNTESERDGEPETERDRAIDMESVKETEIERYKTLFELLIDK